MTISYSKQTDSNSNQATQLNHIKHLIGGQLIATEKTLPIYQPATGELINQVCAGTAGTVDAAVAAAKEAYPAWKAFSPLKRARIFFQFKSLLEQHKNSIAKLISREHGKTLSDAQGEVQRGIEVVEFACGAPHLLKGHYSASIASGVDCYDVRAPIGVCVGITPFNFPAMVPLWMFPLALVCGNTFILKPSEKDPSACLFIAELLTQAGLPNGVLNIVHGDKTVVDALLIHPDVAAVSFVGSTPIAKYIYATASAHGKRVQALGGAKNHCVVMPDANIDKIVPGIIGAAYGSAGERCMALSVVVAVGDETADELVTALKSAAEALKIGPSDAPEVEMGPVISAAHRDRILSLIKSGIDQGAKVILDGRYFSLDDYENGFYLGPTLFDKVKTSMTIYQEEIFGPVLCIVRVQSLAKAVELINQNPYANGAVIYTENGAAAQYFSQNMHAGMIGINVPIPVPLAFYTFGGWKNSLFGAQHMYGTAGIDFYTRTQTVSTRWEYQHDVQTHFNMPVLE